MFGRSNFLQNEGSNNLENESLEDAIVQLYKRKINNSSKKRMGPMRVNRTASPYLQKVAPKTLSVIKKPPAFPNGERGMIKRPSSAKPNASKQESGESEDEQASSRKQRQIRKRPSSAHVPSNRSTTSSLRLTMSSPKPIHKRKMVNVITCQAYVNGCHERPVKLVEANLKHLLQSATIKLGLTMAARRVFHEDGTEIFRSEDIDKDENVFVSMGEPFRNFITAENPKKKGRRKGRGITSRLANKKTKRILVFANGKGCESRQVLWELPDSEKLQKMDEQERFDFAEYQKKKFLDSCSTRLNLNSPATKWFNWKGENTEIESLEQVDHLVHPTQTVFGPIWVSKSRGFDTSGCEQFLEISMEKLKSEISELKKQLDLVKKKREENEKRKERLLEESYFNDEIYVSSDDEEDDVINDEIKQLKLDIKTFRNVLNKYRKRCKWIVHSDFDLYPSIKEIDANDSKLGKHGLRILLKSNDATEMLGKWVKVPMNSVLRGSKNDKKLQMFRFLEQLTTLHKPVDGSCTARSLLIRRIFDKDGCEIFDVNAIEQEQTLIASYGEEFVQQQLHYISLEYTHVSPRFDAQGNVVEICKQAQPQEEFCLENPKRWEITEGIPNSSGEEQNKESESSGKMEEYSLRDVYMTSKHKRNCILHVKLLISPDPPVDLQKWSIDKEGFISAAAFPQLVMSVDLGRRVRLGWDVEKELEGMSDNEKFVERRRLMKRSVDQVEGYVVTVEMKCSEKANQKWSFSPSAQICSFLDPLQVLTSVNPKSYNVLQIFNKDKCEFQDCQYMSEMYTWFAILAPKAKDSKAQRWALKQEGNVRERRWTKTKMANQEWRQLGLSWPVKRDGCWNDEHDWPMTGKLLPYAPAVGRKCKKVDDTSVRVKVSNNGEVDETRFAYVVAPDLSSMEKQEVSKMSKKNKEKALEKRKRIEEMELNFFFEKATQALDLQFAARRLFARDGSELFSVKSLKRDDHVFVSRGENFADPGVSKEDARRRGILAKLSRDVAKIDSFCRLRHPPEDLVLELESGVVEGSKIIVNRNKVVERTKTVISEEEEEVQEAEVVDSSEESESEEIEENNFKSAHELAHAKQTKKFKYAWQNVKTPEPSTFDGEDDDTYFSEVKSQPVSRKKKRKKSNQKFEMSEDGYIYPKNAPHLVVGVCDLNEELNSNWAKVVLVRRSRDDPVQIWEMGADKTIRLKCSKKLVLTISLPACEENEEIDFAGCPVTLQALKKFELGRAHQKFSFKESTKQIQAFQTTTQDKEITAANHVSVCTYAVASSECLNQDGYVARLHGNKLKFCTSCSKVMRSKTIMSKIEPQDHQQGFVCAMSDAEKHGMRVAGSFSYLNGKVDLSRFEAENSLKYWRGKLEKLRRETNMKHFTQQLKQHQPQQAQKLCARKNGEGRSGKGQIVVGSTITGILEQCTYRLQLTSAARRLYTCSGMQILHMEQLLQFADEQLDNKKDETSGKVSLKRAPKDSTPKRDRLEPIEVWVSCGENFQPLDGATANRAASATTQEGFQLETEKHVLRQMTGRRLNELSCVDLRSNNLNQAAHYKSGAWTETPQDETDKMEMIERLEKQLEVVQQNNNNNQKNQRNSKTKKYDLSRPLYQQHKKKRVQVYANGESPRTTCYVWGGDIGSLLAAATARLNLPRPARRLYDHATSTRLTDFDHVTADHLLCVTCGEDLRGRPKQSNVEMKAKLSRARRNHVTSEDNQVSTTAWM